jgi:hypothetical protein
MNAGNLDIYLGMFADTLHNFGGRGLLEVDGLAVPLKDGIFRRLHRWRKSKHALVEQNGLLHIGGRQHGADSFRDERARHH